MLIQLKIEVKTDGETSEDFSCAVNVDGARVGVVQDPHFDGLMVKVDSILYDRSYVAACLSRMNLADRDVDSTASVDDQREEEEIEEEIE
jgi:hypothetical protein